MPNDGKTTTDVYQRFPKNRKTLGVRWLKRHGVTAPLASDCRQIAIMWQSFAAIGRGTSEIWLPKEKKRLR